MMCTTRLPSMPAFVHTRPTNNGYLHICDTHTPSADIPCSADRYRLDLPAVLVLQDTNKQPALQRTLPVYRLVLTAQKPHPVTPEAWLVSYCGPRPHHTPVNPGSPRYHDSRPFLGSLHTARAHCLYPAPTQEPFPHNTHPWPRSVQGGSKAFHNSVSSLRK